MSGLQVNMTKGSILKSLLIFSLPILMSNLFQQLYNTMDILIVGNYLGDSSLAAIGASSSIYELLIGFCFGVGSGLSIVVSRYYGYGDSELIKKAVAGAIVIAGCGCRSSTVSVFCIFVSKLCFQTDDPFLKLCGFFLHILHGLLGSF